MSPANQWKQRISAGGPVPPNEDGIAYERAEYYLAYVERFNDEGQVIEVIDYTKENDAPSPEQAS